MAGSEAIRIQNPNCVTDELWSSVFTYEFSDI